MKPERKKRMKKRKLLSLLLTAVLAVSMVACGNQETVTNNAQDSGNTQTEGTTNT